MFTKRLKVSLKFIAERLSFSEESYTIISHADSKFQSIRLLTDDTHILKNSVLYLGKHIPDKIAYENGSGILLPGAPVNLPCDAIFVDTDISFDEIIDNLLALFAAIDEWTYRIQEIIYNKELNSYIRLVSEILENPAYIVDNSFKVLAIDDSPIFSEISAIWKTLVELGYLPFHFVDQLIKSGELEAIVSRAKPSICHLDYFNNEFINYNLSRNNSHLGHLFIVGYCRKITPGDLELSEALGDLLVANIIEAEDFNIARRKGYEYFLIDVLVGKLRDQTLICEQLKPLGWSMNEVYCVMSILPSSGNITSYEYLLSRLSFMENLKPVILGEHIAAVFRISKAFNYQTLIAEITNLCCKTKCQIGLSDTFEGFINLNIHYIQSCAALNLGLKQDTKQFLYFYQNLALPHLFTSCDKNLKPEIFCHPAIFTLQEYDKAHDTPYYETLNIYLRNERNIQKTANFLHIHRNTFLYRLQKIQDITSIDLENPSIRGRLCISFFLMDYIKAFHK